MSKARRKSARRSRGAQGMPRNGSGRDNGDTSFWLHRVINLRLISVAIFIVAVIVTCFLGQSPPSLKVPPGMIARESVYSDRSFDYNSTVLTERRRENAEKSTPRVFARDMDAEERFTQGVEDLRLKLGSSLNSDPGEDFADRSVQQLKDTSSIILDVHEFAVFSLIKDEEDRNRTFREITTVVREINEIGILEARTEDQRFLSFKEAETKLQSQCREITRQLRLVGGLDVSQDLLLALDLDAFEEEYPALRTILSENKFTNPAEPFPEGGVTIGDLIDSKEAEVSAEANIFAQQFEEALGALGRQGLRERRYDEAETEARALAKLAALPNVRVEVAEGELIIRQGDRITLDNHEKYQTYREKLSAGNELLYERLFMALAIFMMMGLYVKLLMPDTWENGRKLGIVGVAVLLNLVLSRLILELGHAELFGTNATFIAVLPYSLPFSFGAMVTAIAIGPRSAMLTAFLVGLFHSTMQGSDLQTFVSTLAGGLTASVFCRDVQYRSRVVRAGALSGAVVALFAFGFSLTSGFEPAVVLPQVVVAVFVGSLGGVLVVGILPLFEMLFKITTDVTLLELTDFNRPLLRRMQMEAPGTYHHSLMVANLSENAALAVGGNSLMCRTCSLYHDIGKMGQPEYFSENQAGNDNPHERRNPSMSTLIIKSHVKEGVEMARQNKLPEVVIEVIKQHHGTTLVRYFYHEAVRKSKQTKLPLGEKEEVDEGSFRYDGPRPRFKESAIIFFADSVEAASRSLKKVTSRTVDDLLDSIFAERLDDGQLDECALTLDEIKLIKQSFKKTILNMLHARVEYPELEKGKENGKEREAVRTEVVHK